MARLIARLPEEIVDGHAPLGDGLLGVGGLAAAEEGWLSGVGGRVLLNDRLGQQVHVPHNQRPGSEVVRPLGGYRLFGTGAVVALAPHFGGEAGA